MNHRRVELQLPGGTIVGLGNEDVIHVRGLRYAEARRFRAPEAVDAWEGVVDCTGPAPICPQNTSRLNFVTGDLNQGRRMDEDCLSVTVTAPAQFSQQKSSLPVMVWFHGGAFLSGGGDLDCYLPQGLVRSGIVVVNVTYRVGIFGYLPIDDDVPANLGLLDQIEALRWVQKNISAFGGDPSRVTIAGQSAGALSVACMMITEQADGLFQRAILHSTPLGLVQDISDDKSRQLSAYSKSQLRGDLYTASAEELLLLQTKILIESRKLGINRAFYPRFGQSPLPVVSNLEHMITRNAGTVPILIAWMQDEATAFLPMVDEFVYYMKMPLIGGLFKTIFNWTYSGKIFIWPSQRLHKAYLQAGGLSSTCCFRYRPQGSTLGATHCLDLPYLFGHPTNWKHAPMVQSQDCLDVIQGVGEDVKALWVSFISGDHLEPCHYDIAQICSMQKY